MAEFKRELEEALAIIDEQRRELEGLRRAASKSKRWEHAHDCGEFGAVTFRTCTCGLDKFRAALTEETR